MHAGGSLSRGSLLVCRGRGRGTESGIVARMPHVPSREPPSLKSGTALKRGRLGLGERLIRKFNASRPGLNACACTARGFARISRYLLILIALSLITMPITEHIWAWDRFLQGGQDFELGALLVLSFLCLVLVLSKQCQRWVESSLSTWCVAASHFMNSLAQGICLAGEISVFNPEPGTNPGTGRSEFPLQI